MCRSGVNGIVGGVGVACQAVPRRLRRRKGKRRAVFEVVDLCHRLEELAKDEAGHAAAGLAHGSCRDDQRTAARGFVASRAVQSFEEIFARDRDVHGADTVRNRRNVHGRVARRTERHEAVGHGRRVAGVEGLVVPRDAKPNAARLGVGRPHVPHDTHEEGPGGVDAVARVAHVPPRPEQTAIAAEDRREGGLVARVDVYGLERVGSIDGVVLSFDAKFGRHSG
mmetsp:Transcript_1332/g.4342  ORF Transcript_1332/g.4342 Transcript_1332/m.4342 type:complete len:224 (+) Transcript_1332:665-1336(+)